MPFIIFGGPISGLLYITIWSDDNTGHCVGMYNINQFIYLNDNLV